MTEERTIELIVEHEGGLNEDESESVGGVSNFGITQQAFNELGFKGSVRDLTREDPRVQKFYHKYLYKYHVWELPEFLQYIYADFVTNAGSKATKIIQEFAGVEADGIWGSGTSRAVAAWREQVEAELETDKHVDNEIILCFHDAKIAHYDWLIEENPDTYKRWERGWKMRAQEILAELKEYFVEGDKPPSIIDKEERDMLAQQEEHVVVDEPPVHETDEVEDDDLLADIIKRSLTEVLTAQLDELRTVLNGVNKKLQTTQSSIQIIESKLETLQNSIDEKVEIYDNKGSEIPNPIEKKTGQEKATTNVINRLRNRKS